MSNETIRGKGSIKEIFKVLNIEDGIGLWCMVFNKEDIGLHEITACPMWTIFYVKGIFGEEGAVMIRGGN